MSRTSEDALTVSLATRGVTRRDFLGWCGAMAALVGLSEAAAPRIAGALTTGAALKPVVWLAQGSCTGCTDSVAQTGYPDVPTLVLDLLSVDYWEAVMAASGADAERAKADTIAAGGYLLVVEGAVMKGFDGFACRIAGRSGLDHLREAASKADAVIAIGSCAVDGGWCAAGPNPGGAVGVQDVPELIGGKPVINLPACPVNPEWVVAVIVQYLLLGKLPPLDARGRPSAIYGSTIHDTCPRRGHFEAGEFVDAFGAAAETSEWCLYRMGCKGPATLANCPRVRWNRKASWCVESGSPCIGCADHDWVDTDAPFLRRVPDTLGLRPETIGAAVGAVALGGIAVHGVAQTITGRMGHGGPTEQRVTVRPHDASSPPLATPVTVPVPPEEPWLGDDTEPWPDDAYQAEEPDADPDTLADGSRRDPFAAPVESDAAVDTPPPVAEGQETLDLPEARPVRDGTADDPDAEGGDE